VKPVPALVAVFLLGRALSAAETARDQIDALATAIQKGDAAGALALFDARTPSLDVIKRNLEALSALPNTSCSIEITRTQSVGGAEKFETNWSLQTSSIANGPLLDRRDTVAITLERAGNSWRITNFSRPDILAPPDPAIFKRIANLATNLNEKDQTDALAAFDSQMKEYGEIDNDIDALITQNDLLCAIDIVSDRETDAVHTLDLDWYLDLKSRADGGPAVQRRERVQVMLKQIRGKWKIVSLSPLSILSPSLTK
jgi:hypothetical protein